MKPDHQFAIELTGWCGPEIEVAQPVNQRFDMFQVDIQVIVFRFILLHENADQLCHFGLTQPNLMQAWNAPAFHGICISNPATVGLSQNADKYEINTNLEL